MQVRVIMLGCGASAGVPLIGGADGGGEWGSCDPSEPRNRRTRSSIVIESEDGRRLLIDTGPDLRAQLLACRIATVDAILFTHAHADHITGLDDVRILNRNLGTPIPAFATERTLSEIKQRFDYAFKPWQPPGFYRPVLVPQVIAPGDRLKTAGLDVEIFDQDHGYLHTLGLRVGRFGYSTDVVRMSEDAFARLDGIDTWIVGCFTSGKPHPTHANLDTVLHWAARVGARRTVLTHMSQDMDWARLKANLPAGVEAGWDGLTIEVAV